MRNLFLLTALLLFVIALFFALTSEPTLLGGLRPNSPNIIGASATLGFAIAGGLALIAAAISDRPNSEG
jgi:hypothetical protein